MAYRVQLAYFRLTGKFLAYADCEVARTDLMQIWEAIHDLRRGGRLPGLRPNAGRDLFIVVDVPDHPERVLHLVMPPFVNDDDVTPIRVPLEEPLSARTTTRDVVKVDLDEEATPVDGLLPKRSPDEP